MHRIIFYFIILLLKPGCKQSNTADYSTGLDKLAVEYVNLALVIGQYDEAFVDAYYGPDLLKPATSPASIFPKDSLLIAVAELKKEIETFLDEKQDSLLRHRAAWIADQLKAFDRRIRIFSGEFGLFDSESRDLFGTAAPVFNEHHYQSLVSQLNHLLPGKGPVPERFQLLANQFIIPKEKLDTVFKTAIAECRKRTLQHLQLPPGEDFRLEYVTGKSWSGYNWYKGKYQSLIQINTDLDIFIDRVIDVGSHESYPGHHVYNMLLERNLYRDQGLTEISVYPLFSPQSLIAEGTANYGIDVVFPGDDKTIFARDVILPLAGLDTAGISVYFKAIGIKGKLNYVRNDVARQLLSGSMTEQEALRWLQEYGLYNEASALKSISFIRTYRSYVINYNYGMDLVKTYVENHGGTDPAQRWKIFETLLSSQVRIEDLTGLEE